MSQQLINRSADLRRLRDEGYDIEIRSNHLLVKNVPYVNSRRQIQYGTLVSVLNLAGDVTTRPGTHVAHFAGEYPCDKNGVEISTIRHQTLQQDLGGGLVIQHSFSSKPSGGYTDYYHKMATYVAILSHPAQALDAAVIPQNFAVVAAQPDDSVFNYIDTASSRAGINAVSQKLEGRKIAIVGLGGTGSYVLDMVAKTPVREIHLFDGDQFLQHNAFRAPGAPSLEELRQAPLKVDYLRQHYSRMHRGIFAHGSFIDASNVEALREMSFVFLCIDRSEPKRLLLQKLEEWNIPFVDVGMGIQLIEESMALIGVLRTTTSTAEKRDHVQAKHRIPLTDPANNDYAQNIQIADLNALNAALAVIKWKKLCGFYLDLEKEHHSTYSLDGNAMTNEDSVEEVRA